MIISMMVPFVQSNAGEEKKRRMQQSDVLFLLSSNGIQSDEMS